MNLPTKTEITPPRLAPLILAFCVFILPVLIALWTLIILGIRALISLL